MTAVDARPARSESRRITDKTLPAWVPWAIAAAVAAILAAVFAATSMDGYPLFTVLFITLFAIYLVEYARGRLGLAVTLFVDVMSGVPSIVAGLFIFSSFILAFGLRAAGMFGSLALAILMLPVMTRTSEEMLRLVPGELREAAYALGVPRWGVIIKVVIPTALPGICTGAMLAVARVIGETAPLLLTIGFTTSINMNAFSGAQGSLPQRAGHPGLHRRPLRLKSIPDG